MEFPIIDVWRMSASRPWQLEKTHSNLIKHLKYSGLLRFHLIESVLVEDLSSQCFEVAMRLGYKIHVIKPAQGQGFAVNHALQNVITSEFSLKFEDDFMPVRDIPLDDCVQLMQQYLYINQICFNKRETMAYKMCQDWSDEQQKLVPFAWPKEQRYFKVGDKNIPLVVKEKWWFGSAIWRTSFIKPIFKYWKSNTHNLFNDHVILPMAGAIPGEPNGKGKRIPTPEDIEKHIGCYIYGKTGDPPMVEHTGLGDSIWAGEFQRKMAEEGRQIIGF